MNHNENINSWEIREIKPDEIEDFLDLLEISFKDSLEEEGIDVPELRRIMKKLFRPHYKLITRIMKVKSEFYIIENNKQMVSGITLGIEREEGSVGNVMTHPDYRQRGLARRLLSFCAERARALGLKKLFLSVNAENTPAVSLYQSEGYDRNYHACRFKYDILKNDIQQSNSTDIRVTLVDRIDEEIMDGMLDDSFPSFYFESRNRKKWIKDYVPSRALRYIVKKAAGQTINTYGFLVNSEKNPRGYIQASQSRVDDHISLSSPILLKEDNGLLPKILPQIIQNEYSVGEISLFTLSMSMHRHDAINRIEQMGFTKVRESLSMVKFIK